MSYQPPTPAEIRAALDLAGVTPYRAALLVGVHRSTVGRWLTGEQAISKPHWLALRSVLEGVYFLDG